MLSDHAQPALGGCVGRDGRSVRQGSDGGPGSAQSAAPPPTSKSPKSMWPPLLYAAWNVCSPQSWCAKRAEIMSGGCDQRQCRWGRVGGH